ncbi:MAG: cytochrome c [Devosia sp.]
MKTLSMTITAALALGTVAAAADPAAGRQKASQCQVCHGYDGLGTNPEVPHIAGESEVYLMKQLRAFRSGERQHRQMSIVASGLSDQDIRDLADYYGSITISVTVPEY